MQETGKYEINIRKKRTLVCEALVREILHANRWSAVEEAWRALLKVRRLSNVLISEQEKPQTESQEKPRIKSIVVDSVTK